MAGLKIQVDDADAAFLELLARFELDPDLLDQGRVADAAGGRHEGDGDRFPALVRGLRREPAFRDDFEDFVRGTRYRDPIGSLGSDQALVVGGRYFVADQDEKGSIVSFLHRGDQTVEIILVMRRADHQHI